MFKDYNKNQVVLLLDLSHTLQDNDIAFSVNDLSFLIIGSVFYFSETVMSQPLLSTSATFTASAGFTTASILALAAALFFTAAVFLAHLFFGYFF
ncbi:hypothetical protein SAMN05192534_12078 [Alteribacillus persepolensis]|uniref:Uncharacterized protein n=1 Tax=Alteribacillus persepolensis TaxID=568899 RepID=A0A1G8HMD7_9BACI|nr:hypothetical protein SAMN05192534_12078 [Alteribacillus persepolensis]